MINDPSRSSKVVDFGTNRKRVWDFLYWSSIATLILSHSVSEILELLYTKTTFSIPHRYSGQNFGVFLLG